MSLSEFFATCSSVAEVIEDEILISSMAEQEMFIMGLVSQEMASELDGYLREWNYPLSFRRERDGSVILGGKWRVPVEEQYAPDDPHPPLILNWSGITVIP